MGILLTMLVLLLTLQVARAAEGTAPKVKTVPYVTLEFGKEATLTCVYNWTVYAVYWRYQSDTSPKEDLVALDQYFRVGERSGLGYEEGRFNITDDYSLNIRDVKVHDEGRYICEVADFSTGRVFRNYTDVTVDVVAEQPFVRILQCKDEVYSEVENSSCILYAKRDHHSFELSCSVVRAKPEVKLSWTSPEHWDQEVNASTLKAQQRSDGAFDQTLTISINTSQLIESQSFTCVAEGVAVYGIANRTIKVFVLEDKKGFAVSSDFNTSKKTIIAVLSVVGAIILIAILGKVIKRNKGSSNEKQPSGGEQRSVEDPREEEEEKLISLIDRRRNEIKRNIDSVKGQTPLYFGVFGNKEAGKSSFIDSLIFAFTGGNHSSTFEDSTRNKETLWSRTIRRPSNDIALREIEDMRKLDCKTIKQLLKPISEKDGDLHMGSAIHYPIFVYDFRNSSPMSEQPNNYEKLLSVLSEAVNSKISQYPILFLTHITPSKSQDPNKIMQRLSNATCIPVDNIFFTGTNTVDDKANKGEILYLLEILLTCVKNVKFEGATQQIGNRNRARENWRQLFRKVKNKEKETATWKRWKYLLSQVCQEVSEINE